MAVSYAAKVYTNDKLFFAKLLFRWTGSVWQLLWVDFLFYVFMYVTLACIYRLAIFETPNKRQFDRVAKWIGLIRESIPLSFLLGFFVSSIVTRWWSMIMTIPWLHGPSYLTQALLQGGEKYGDLARKMRLTFLRYLNVAWILCLADFSMQVKNRFNFKRKSTSWKGQVSKDYELTWRQRLALINKDEKVRKYFGTLLTQPEIETFAKSAELSSDDDFSYSLEYWIPLMWASRLLNKARQMGCITDDRHFMRLVNIVNDFRGGLGTLWIYSELNIPLVYTQVATMGVYIYLLSGLFSSQMIDDKLFVDDDALPESMFNSTNPKYNLHVSSPLLYIPIISAFEFIFYLGWFKIGMCLMNPLGEDEEDLPLSDFLNYNLKISVKCGGSENSLFPPGLPEEGLADQQIIEVLSSFDFSQVRAHDKFESPEETEARINAELRKRLKKKSPTQHDSVRYTDSDYSLAKRMSSKQSSSEDISDSFGSKWNLVKSFLGRKKKESEPELPVQRKLRRTSSLNDLNKYLTKRENENDLNQMTIHGVPNVSWKELDLNGLVKNTSSQKKKLKSSLNASAASSKSDVSICSDTETIQVRKKGRFTFRKTSTKTNPNLNQQKSQSLEIDSNSLSVNSTTSSKTDITNMINDIQTESGNPFNQDQKLDKFKFGNLFVKNPKSRVPKVMFEYGNINRNQLALRRTSSMNDIRSYVHSVESLAEEEDYIELPAITVVPVPNDLSAVVDVHVDDSFSLSSC